MSIKIEMTESTDQGQEDISECQHKPGEVWENGCCTSRKNKTTKESTKEDASTIGSPKDEFSPVE